VSSCFALCERKETKEDTPEKRQAREKLFGEKFQAKAKQLLRELRKASDDRAQVRSRWCDRSL